MKFRIGIWSKYGQICYYCLWSECTKIIQGQDTRVYWNFPRNKCMYCFSMPRVYCKNYFTFHLHGLLLPSLLTCCQYAATHILVTNPLRPAMPTYYTCYLGHYMLPGRKVLGRDSTGILLPREKEYTINTNHFMWNVITHSYLNFNGDLTK